MVRTSYNLGSHRLATGPAASMLAPVSIASAQQSKRGQRSAGPSVVPLISGKQLPELALDPAPGCVLNSCRPVAEHLDSGVTGIHDVDVATGINRDTVGVFELPWSRATVAPLGDVATTVGEHLDAIIVHVCDVDVAAGINCDTVGAVELPGPRAEAAPLGDVATTVSEHLDALANGALPDVDVATGINRDTPGA